VQTECASSPPEILFELLYEAAGPKGRKSLLNVRAACEKIEASSGKLSYAGVSRVAVLDCGGPREQTILNSKPLKTYIDARQLERDLGRNGATRKASLRSPKGPNTEYPAENLDAKTRSCIDILRQAVEVKEKEIRFLSGALEALTIKTPLEFEKAISGGPTSTGDLRIESGATGAGMPAALRLTLLSILSSRVGQWVVEARGESRMLSGKRDGVSEVMLTPTQYEECRRWIGAKA
jgi:hypothetical protein